MAVLFLVTAGALMIPFARAFSPEMFLAGMGVAFFGLFFRKVATSRFEIHWDAARNGLLLLTGAHGMHRRRKLYLESDFKSLHDRRVAAMSGASNTLYFETNSGTEEYVCHLLESELEVIPSMISEAMKSANVSR